VAELGLAAVGEVGGQADVVDLVDGDRDASSQEASSWAASTEASGDVEA
jgi:hypothetical protein